MMQIYLKRKMKTTRWLTWRPHSSSSFRLLYLPMMFIVYSDISVITRVHENHVGYAMWYCCRNGEGVIEIAREWRELNPLQPRGRPKAEWCNCNGWSSNNIVILQSKWFWFSIFQEMTEITEYAPHFSRNQKQKWLCSEYKLKRSRLWNIDQGDSSGQIV